MKAPTLEDLDREIQQVRHRMRRFVETGDLKRLAKLRGRLNKLQAALNTIKTIRTQPIFRVSYAYESWIEKLLEKHSSSKFIDTYFW
jgi:fatty acid-binding protein DegV